MKLPSPPVATAVAPIAAAAWRKRRLSSPVGTGAVTVADVRALVRAGCLVEARCSSQKAPEPMRAAAIEGIAQDGFDVGLPNAAATPTSPSAAMPTYPSNGLLIAATPRNAEITARTAEIPTSNATLSLVPKVRIAKDLSHSGEPSMTVWPTARRGEAGPATKAATRCPAPSATAATRTPLRAPRVRWLEALSPGVVFCGVVLGSFVSAKAPGSLRPDTKTRPMIGTSHTEPGTLVWPRGRFVTAKWEDGIQVDAGSHRNEPPAWRIDAPTGPHLGARSDRPDGRPYGPGHVW